MMKPIVVASYLGVLQTIIATMPMEENDQINREMLQALREAQMYFYELARQEMLKEMGYEETDSTV